MKLVALNRKEIIRKLKKFGFQEVSSKKHLKLSNGNITTVISGQHKEDISPDMISTILKQCKINRTDWISA